jgi:hypothetical protein
VLNAEAHIICWDPILSLVTDCFCYDRKGRFRDLCWAFIEGGLISKVKSKGNCEPGREEIREIGAGSVDWAKISVVSAADG